ncbi:MAG: pyridoxamine 5'-phosphate oxidase family protein [Candidatus Omnitrophota bacterium]
MKELNDDITQLLRDQGAVTVCTLDASGSIHSACKGIVDIEKKGRIYLLDLYLRKTFANLKRNPSISITVCDEHRFVGYCLKGKAKILKSQDAGPHILKAWEDKISSRISKRIVKNIRGEKGHPLHPEAMLPRPEYMIAMEVEEIVDLAPVPIKHKTL